MSCLRIEVLSRQHRVLLKGFRSQEQSLVDYLKRFALRHADKDLLSRTYLAIHADGESERGAGYFSLSTVSIERGAVDPISSLAGLPRFPIPGVLLARLAVDERLQGQGLGRYLLEEALRITLHLTVSGPVAFRLLVTDGISEDAVAFYQHFGLSRLSGTLPSRMVLDLKPLVSPHEQLGPTLY